MKKVIGAFFTSTLLFWLFFVLSVIFLMIQMIVRFIIPADSFGEAIWKALLMYAVMVGVCMFKVQFRSREPRKDYCDHLGNGDWSFGNSLKYTLKNREFLLTALFFMIWPLIVPGLMGNFNHLFFFYAPTIPEKVPLSILCLFTVDLPYFCLYLLANTFVQKKWAKERLRRGGQNDEDKHGTKS